MKKIEATVRQNRLEDVKEALLRCGVDRMTVTEVFGRGDQNAPTVTYRGVTGSTSFVPRVAFVHHRSLAPVMPMAAVSASFEVYDERFK
jgi:nitrogen regulatory protein PII